jgi:LAO/AO transport system kinase
MDTRLDKLLQGDRRSLARAMSLVEQSNHEATALKDQLRRSTGMLPWWGFTGPPGVGKSTLIDALLGELRRQRRRVGVVAVDPSSPLSGGALLGDRVRMMRHAVDQDVFIRSMATHDCEGGLSDATLHCARLLEMARFDPVLIETVGVGQNEAEIASIADICVVILGPGYGDEIQLIKAGLLEIADIVAINKCDLPEANRLLEAVRAELGHSPSAATVEIIAVEARSAKGVDRLLQELLERDRSMRDPKQRQQRRRRQLVNEIRGQAMLTYEQALERELGSPAAETLFAGLESGKLSLDEVVRKLSVISGQRSAKPDAGP